MISRHKPTSQHLKSSQFVQPRPKATFETVSTSDGIGEIQTGLFKNIQTDEENDFSTIQSNDGWLEGEYGQKNQKESHPVGEIKHILERDKAIQSLQLGGDVGRVNKTQNQFDMSMPNNHENDTEKDKLLGSSEVIKTPLESGSLFEKEFISTDRNITGQLSYNKKNEHVVDKQQISDKTKLNHLLNQDSQLLQTKPSSRASSALSEENRFNYLESEQLRASLVTSSIPPHIIETDETISSLNKVDKHLNQLNQANRFYSSNKMNNQLENELINKIKRSVQAKGNSTNSQQAEPTINITIGKVEVKAQSQIVKETSAKSSDTGMMSLDTYLKNRSKGKS